MQDGVLENFTGAVLEPYLGRDGRPTDDLGSSQVDPDALCGYVTRLDALGFQAHIHAIGERAVREALDAVEAARRANGPSPTPVPTSRTSRSSTPTTSRGSGSWTCRQRPAPVGRPGGPDGASDDPVPRARSDRPGSIRSVRCSRPGATLAMGSDWSVSTANPLLQMEVAVDAGQR